MTKEEIESKIIDLIENHECTLSFEHKGDRTFELVGTYANEENAFVLNGSKNHLNCAFYDYDGNEWKVTYGLYCKFWVYIMGLASDSYIYEEVGFTFGKMYYYEIKFDWKEEPIFLSTEEIDSALFVVHRKYDEIINKLSEDLAFYRSCANDLSIYFNRETFRWDFRAVCGDTPIVLSISVKDYDAYIGFCGLGKKVVYQTLNLFGEDRFKEFKKELKDLQNNIITKEILKNI